MRAVDAMPRSTMSTPCEHTPRANAAVRSTPDGRMSRATSTVGAAAKRANAAPIASHISASSCSGTTPRMSYALKTESKSPIARKLVVAPHRLVLGRVRALARPSPDAEQVAHDPDRVARHAHRRARRVGDGHRHLGQRQAAALHDREHLDVE